MVERGQFLERATLIPSGQRMLEGLWHRGARAPAVLLIPPPPGQGSMDDAVLAELAFALARAGHASLRFNFGGVGGSRGASPTAASQRADARAAARVLRESAGTTSLVGVGLRAGGSIACALGGLFTKVVLISPPVALAKAVEGLEVPGLIALGEHEGSRTEWGRLDAKVALVPHADASWLRGLPQLGREVVDFVGEIER